MSWSCVNSGASLGTFLVECLQAFPIHISRIQQICWVTFFWYHKETFCFVRAFYSTALILGLKVCFNFRIGPVRLIVILCKLCCNYFAQNWFLASCSVLNNSIQSNAYPWHCLKAHPSNPSILRHQILQLSWYWLFFDLSIYFVWLIRTRHSSNLHVAIYSTDP